MYRIIEVKYENEIEFYIEKIISVTWNDYY